MDECNGLRIGRQVTYDIAVYSSFITGCVVGPVNSFYHLPRAKGGSVARHNSNNRSSDLIRQSILTSYIFIYSKTGNLKARD